MTKECNNLEDQVKFIDNRIFESIQEVKDDIKANTKDCPGARIISKLDELRIDLNGVDARGQKLISDINQITIRLTNMENKKIQQSDMPNQVLQGMQNLFDDHENTKKTNAKLVEKIKVLEDSQESMSLAIGQILERLNQQGSNRNDASEATLGMHSNQTPGG